MEKFKKVDSEITLMHGDCLKEMDNIEDGSVDLVLADPPYGTTACKWDSVISFEPMWRQLNKVIKKNGAVVLFGSEPFSSALRMSNIKQYKYDWVWEKNIPVGHTIAKLRPMMKHEIIMVFSCGGVATGAKNIMPYYPQELKPCNIACNGRRAKKENQQNQYRRESHKGYLQGWTNYPCTVLKFKKETSLYSIHPTQKPVKLMEYLIKTYTNKNETVLDFTMGSGSTAIAAVNTGRHFIGIELLPEKAGDPKYYDIAKNRILNHQAQQKLF